MAAATRDLSLIAQPSHHGLRKYRRELQKKKRREEANERGRGWGKSGQNSPERGRAGCGEATAIERACRSSPPRVEVQGRRGNQPGTERKPTCFIKLNALSQRFSAGMDLTSGSRGLCFGAYCTRHRPVLRLEASTVPYEGRRGGRKAILHSFYSKFIFRKNLF